HGRVEAETVTLNGKATVTSYCYDCEEAPGQRVSAPVDLPAHIKALQGRIKPLQRKLLDDEPVLTIFQTVTGWDHKEAGSPEESRQKTMSLTHSLLTGEPVLFEDNNGVRILTQYDELRRVTDEIVAPDQDDFKATRHYEYTLCGANSSESKQIMTNVRGVITTTYVDGLGRPVRECRSHIDENKPNTSMETVSITYNTFGQKVSETLIDYLPKMPTENDPTPSPIALPLTRTFAYNSWGEECCVTGADGVQHHKFIEPTGSTTHKGPIEHAWRQGSGGATQISGKTESWLNAFDKPMKTQRLLANGKAYAEQHYEYDGLGNCRVQKDERTHSTRFDFDTWDRMTQTTLADGTQVTRDYAEHTRKELATAIRAHSSGASMRPLGSQTFDGLDRLGSKTTGNRTEHLFYPAGMTRPERLISANGDEISFDYDPQLTDAPKLTKAPEGDAEFTFNKTSARLEKAINQQGTRTYEYDWNNRVTLERWSDDQNKPLYAIRQGISLHGRMCWQKIDNGPDSTFTYDEHGRPKKTSQGNLESDFYYDTLGQLEKVELVDLQTQEKLTTTFIYDDQGREKKRTFKRGAQPERSITQEWAPGNLLELRHLEEGKTSLLREEFIYNERGRLCKHLCSGRDLPRNEQDQEYTAQAFTYDGLDNITSRTTTLKDQTEHTATFKYEEEDPCQLSRVIYSPARPDTPERFDYDANGCQLNDEHGRSMRYDSEKRLLQVSKTSKKAGGTYHYDAHGHLIRTKQAEGSDDTLLLFEKNRLRLAIRGEIQTHLLHAGNLPLGQQQADDTSMTRMFSCTASGSVIADSPQPADGNPGYSAYGQRFGALASLLGFNGEYLDPDSGWYLLGRGHRAYNPELMRFQGPDTLSPFGNGGINCYAYCQGNPITFSDPTGRASRGLAERDERGLAKRGKRGVEVTPEQQWMIQQQQGGGSGVWIALGVGILFTALSIVATIVTLGAAAGAVAVSMSATAASAGAVAGTTSAAMAGAAVAGTSAVAAVGAMSASAALLAAAPQVVMAGMSVAGTIAQVVSFGVETAANFTLDPSLAEAAKIVGYVTMVMALSDNLSGLAIQRIGQTGSQKPAGSGLGSQWHDQKSNFFIPRPTYDGTTQSSANIRM
ncbi:RHS repeat domain-containing protein, partial [Pseudomonas soli]|uniref:RHS repeat domain-containing protein n=1 Tax=Pseudomonas soli TaxID=1306993 RepID=UPI0028AA51BB